MRYIRVSYKNHSKTFNILFFGISISITLGLIIALCLDKELLNNIYIYFLEHINTYNSNMFDNILYPIITYLIIFIISLTIIGCFTPFLTVFLENTSIGFILGILIRKNALKGLLFGIIYFTITKLIYIIVLLYLTINIYKFIKTLISSLKKKNNEGIYNLYSKILIKLVFCIISVTIINLLNIFIAPKLFKLFIFLL